MRSGAAATARCSCCRTGNCEQEDAVQPVQCGKNGSKTLRRYATSAAPKKQIMKGHWQRSDKRRLPAAIITRSYHEGKT